MAKSVHSVNVVILDAERQQVLLHLRQDFRVWALPGGGVEPGEAWEDAARREAWEETGYEIAVERWIGEYHIAPTPHGQDHKRVYLARVIGGQPLQRGPETRRLGWFAPDRLPRSLNSLHRAYVRHALDASAEPLRLQQRNPLWRFGLLSVLIPIRDLLNRITRHA